MSPVVRRLAALLALALFAASPFAQEITALDQATVTLGSIVRVSGTDLGTKPKLVLVQDESKAKGASLKVVGSGEGYVDVTIKKAKAGTYQVAVAKGKSLLTTSADSLEVVPPTVVSVDPDSAEPNDEVDVLVSYAGSAKLKAVVGTTKAKVVAVTPVEPPPGESAPQSRVTIRVPKVPNGVWPVSVMNPVGKGILKGALEVTGSTKALPKPSVRLDIDGVKKPFKASKKHVAVVDDSDGFAVLATSGSKKSPSVLRITVPEALEDVAPGDSYDADPGQIVYSVTDKSGTTIWAAEPAGEGNTWVVDVVALDDEGTLVLFLCGCLTRQSGDAGDETICVLGLVTVDTSVEVQSGGLCDPLCTATGSVTGDFVSVPQENIALFGIAGPGLLKCATGSADGGGGFPATVIEWTISFDPAHDATPATFDGISLQGSGLISFSMQLDTTFYTQSIDMNLDSSMSVTITQVDDAPSNPFGILACLHGTFSGVVTNNATIPPTPQTLTGEFVMPWYDTGFGQ
ncbi:MAG: hypothetical protein H6825_08320 [Planctomycetes bacterium]|nr:hypothetical protein [Planctomycetota bacterium]